LRWINGCRAAHGYLGCMPFPIQVSLQGLASSEALQDAIREKAEKLGRYYAHITACRVVVALEARHKRQGRQFSARVDLKVPGTEIAVTHAHDEDVLVALRDAFDAARRRLEDYAREQRGDVKRHA
jgi:ribosomal subunit interface protein